MYKPLISLKMKTTTIIKQLLFTLLVIAGLNIYSSCDSCNRKDDSTQENTTDTDSYESADEEDTITTGDNTGMNDGSTSSTSINATSGSGNGKNGTTSGSSKTPNTAGTATASGSSKDDAAKQQAITDMIENSDAKSAVDKNGKPIRSSGDAGTGTGTGTGSTGNNSRVTTREAQKAN
jgi:hypothetical protein